MNLARAFLIAGSRSVVATLWAVNDRSTATLMESFYVHLKAGSSVSKALRKAQRDFVHDYGNKRSSTERIGKHWLLWLSQVQR